MIKRPTCDVCKKEAYLTSLKEEFQTDEIKGVIDNAGKKPIIRKLKK